VSEQQKPGVVTTTPEGGVVFARSGYEYFCHACKQLRLWVKEGLPNNCGNCNSEDIVVAEPGSPLTGELRYGVSPQGNTNE
jgi:hypothetical protein